VSVERAKVLVGRVMLLSAAVLVLLGIGFLTGLLPVGDGVRTIVGAALVGAGAVEGGIGIKMLVSHVR
jgi:hypothetical protein